MVAPRAFYLVAFLQRYFALCPRLYCKPTGQRIDLKAPLRRSLKAWRVVEVQVFQTRPRIQGATAPLSKTTNNEEPSRSLSPDGLWLSLTELSGHDSAATSMDRRCLDMTRRLCRAKGQARGHVSRHREP